MANCSLLNFSGDIINWKKKKWTTVEDVIVEDIEPSVFCIVPLIKQIATVPEPVTFQEAKFLSNFMSCKIPSLQDNLTEISDMIKNELNLQVEILVVVHPDYDESWPGL